MSLFFWFQGLLSPASEGGDEESDDDTDDDVMEVDDSGRVGDDGVRRAATAALDLLNDEQLVLRMVETVTQVTEHIFYWIENNLVHINKVKKQTQRKSLSPLK